MVEVTEANKAQFRIQQVILPLPGLSTPIPAYLQTCYDVGVMMCCEA